MKRRDFIKLGTSVTLASVMALNFGCSVAPLVKDEDKKVAILYATRYGATKDTTVWIAEGLGRKVTLLNIEDVSFSQIAKEYDYFIIGSGVWIDGVHNDMIKFLETQKEELKDKIVASFILCGTTAKDVKGEARIQSYFYKFHAPLDVKPQLSAHFGGRMKIEQLNDKDRKILTMFYKKILKRDFVSWDRTEPKRAKGFGLKLKEIKT